MEGEILFSFRLEIRPLWLLWPAGLYLLGLALSAFLPRWADFRSRKALRRMAALQALFLLGHLYAFAVEIVPYWLGRCETAEGEVADFAGPVTRYNPWESFRVGDAVFSYSPHAITFGYHDTVMGNGVIRPDTGRVRVIYVHNPLTGNNAILQIQRLSSGTSGGKSFLLP